MTDEKQPQQRRIDIAGGGRITSKKTETQIVGGSPVPRSGPIKILDKNSPAEPQEAEMHIHADSKSYKDAIENDQ